MRLLTLLFYAAACVLVFVLAVSFTIRLVLLDERTIACPELTGLDIEEAKSVAAQSGLPLVVSKYEKRKDIAYNRVILQNPDAGVPVRSGRTVTVLLADGPMMAIIPAFVGLSLDAAGAALQQQGMKLRKVIYVPSGEANRVLAQVPESGENILDPDGIVLVVGTKGKRFYVMPEIAPGDYAAAVKELDLKQIRHVQVPTGRPDGPPAGPLKTNILPKTIFKDDDMLELLPGSGG